MMHYYSSNTKWIVFFATVFSGCSQEERFNQLFKEVPPTASGIQFRNDLTDAPSQNIIEYLYYYNGGGVCLGDVNNDGLLDIYFTANQGLNRLYINSGNLKFEDKTEFYNLPTLQDTTKWSTGVVMVDVNGDGYLDIYECVVGDYKSFKGNNKLYINQSGKFFVESSREYGLDFSGFSTQSSFFDFDQDGDLDMYLLNHSVHGTDTYGPSSLRLKKDSRAGDRFYENKVSEGMGFVDISDAVGIYNSRIGYGLGIAVSDLNNDGLPDVYIGNDFHEDDYLYLNNGDDTFMEVGRQWVHHTSHFSMGVDIADVNNDGLMDIISLDMLSQDPSIFLKSGGDDDNLVKSIKEKNGYSPQFSRNALQINKGSYFIELAQFAGVYATDWSWSVLIQDFDNDTDNDVFITNGIYKRPNDLDYINYLSNDIKRHNSTNALIEKMPSGKVANMLFKNQGNLTFMSSKDAALKKTTYSSGATYGDLDNDGDLDMVVNNCNDFASILENTAQRSSNFLNISLRDMHSANAFAIGARVTVFVDTLQWEKEIYLTRGFQSAISSRLHYGLHDYDKIDSLDIVWPDGTLQKMKGVEPNQFITIEKSKNVIKRDDPNKKTAVHPYYLNYNHEEDDFEDYQREKLLPWALSKEGPGVAVADLNGDGIDDIYIGGAHFQSGTLFISSPDGTYQKTIQPHLLRDAGYEDIDADFFDINFDGYQDLFIASGGSRFEEGHPLLEDRIYINDGKNNFTRWTVDLPKINSSCVAFTIVDSTRHLFVGARSVPGEYGKKPYSYLLKWTKDKFEPIQFTQMGMVTDAAWVDFSGSNGLMVVGDWMPIQFFSLKDSLLYQPIKKFEDTNGFWNSITIGDLNSDGVEDYFFSNLGLNTRWKPNKEQPIIMHFGDLDDNSQSETIIFHSYFDTYIPFYPRMQLIKQIPSINKKVNSNAKFAKVRKIDDLINGKPDQTLKVFEVESALLLSNEEEYYWKKLPDPFHYGVVQDAVFDSGKVYYIGNDYTHYSILGQSDSNSGGILSLNKNSSWKELNVDPKKDYRRIKLLQDNKLLIVPNSDAPFIVHLDDLKMSSK